MFWGHPATSLLHIGHQELTSWDIASNHPILDLLFSITRGRRVLLSRQHFFSLLSWFLDLPSAVRDYLLFCKGCSSTCCLPWLDFWALQLPAAVSVPGVAVPVGLLCLPN